MFVSHDRYFIDNLATRVFEVGGGEVTPFPGNYEDYLWRKEGESGSQRNGTPADATAHAAAGGGSRTVQGARRQAKAAVAGKLPQDDRNRRLNPIKLRQMKDRSRGIEDEITRLEVEIADLELALGNFVSVEQTVDLNELVTARRKDLENLMAEWEEVEATIQANADAGVEPLEQLRSSRQASELRSARRPALPHTTIHQILPESTRASIWLQ